jgi:hypothetical protein
MRQQRRTRRAKQSTLKTLPFGSVLKYLERERERGRGRLTAVERDGVGGREERPEGRDRFQGIYFCFSKKKKKKKKKDTMLIFSLRFLKSKEQP